MVRSFVDNEILPAAEHPGAVVVKIDGGRDELTQLVPIERKFEIRKMGGRQ